MAGSHTWHSYRLLEQRTDGGIQVGNILATSLHLRTSTDEIKGREGLNHIQFQGIGFEAVGTINADPWQLFGHLRPVMLVGIDRYLIDFQPLGMIFVVEGAELHYALP